MFKKPIVNFFSPIVGSLIYGLGYCATNVTKIPSMCKGDGSGVLASEGERGVEMRLIKLGAKDGADTETSDGDSCRYGT